MRKLLIILSLFFLGFTLTACGEESIVPENNETTDYTKFKDTLLAEFEELYIEMDAPFIGCDSLDEIYVSIYDSYNYDISEKDKIQICKEEAYGYYFLYYVLIENEIDSIINAFQEAELSSEQVNILTDNCDELVKLIISDDVTFDYVDFLYGLKFTSDQIILITYNVINDFDDVIIDSLNSMTYKDDIEWKNAHETTVSVMENITLNPLFTIFDTITDAQLDEFLEIGQISLGTLLDYSYSLDELEDLVVGMLENGVITEDNLKLILTQNAKYFSETFGDITKNDITKVLSFITEFNNALTDSSEVVDSTTVDIIYRSIKSIEATYNYLSVNSTNIYMLVNDYNYIVNTNYNSLSPFEKIEFEGKLVLFEVNSSILLAKLMDNVMNNSNLLSYAILKTVDIDLTSYKYLISDTASHSYYTNVNHITSSTYDTINSFNFAFEDITLIIIEYFQRIFAQEEFYYSELEKFLNSIELGQFEYNYTYFWESADKEDIIIINVIKKGNITYFSNFNSLKNIDEVVYIRYNSDGTIDTKVNGVIVDYTYEIEDNISFDINNFEYLGGGEYIYNNPNDLYDGTIVDVIQGSDGVNCTLVKYLSNGNYLSVKLKRQIDILYF